MSEKLASKRLVKQRLHRHITRSSNEDDFQTFVAQGCAMWILLQMGQHPSMTPCDNHRMNNKDGMERASLSATYLELPTGAMRLQECWRVQAEEEIFRGVWSNVETP